jgi:hypothetical protein
VVLLSKPTTYTCQFLQLVLGIKRAIFSELFTSIAGFRRGRKNLNNEKRIENFIGAIAIELWFAIDNHQIRVGSAPMFRNPNLQIAVIQAKIGVSLQKIQVK